MEPILIFMLSISMVFIYFLLHHCSKVKKENNELNIGIKKLKEQNDRLYNLVEATCKDSDNFHKLQIINMIDNLLERPDILIDSIFNENTNYKAADLFEISKIK